MAWLNTLIYLPLFALTMVGFHLPLLISPLVSQGAFWFFLIGLCRSVLLGLQVAGTRFTIHYENPELQQLLLASNKPVILVCNHQSMYDIPVIMTTFAALRPRFISKRELGKFVPSVSPALHNMGSCLIDRSDKRQAVADVERFAAAFAKKTDEPRCICIFPEGTRARDGVLKPFKTTGFSLLLQAMPDAIVVPLVIDGSYRLMKHKLLPLERNITVSLHVLDPLPTQEVGQRPEMLAEKISEKLVGLRIRH